MIAERVARLAGLLTADGLTLATSESLTGGLIGAALTDRPGSSAYYLGGVIAYHTGMKARLSGVDPEVVRARGVVSAGTVMDMAQGVQRITGADWAVAVTGVAGPDAQESIEPGVVWIGVAGPAVSSGAGLPRAVRFRFAGDRAAVREQTVAAALDLVCDQLTRP